MHNIHIKIYHKIVEGKNSRDHDVKRAVTLLARQNQSTLNKQKIPSPSRTVHFFVTTKEHPLNLPNREMDMDRHGDKTRTERLSTWVLNPHQWDSNFSFIIHLLHSLGQITSQCLNFLSCKGGIRISI